jgi:hypothetical protein
VSAVASSVAATAVLVCEGACNGVAVEAFEEQRRRYALALNTAGRVVPPDPPDGSALRMTTHVAVAVGRWECTRCGKTRSW